MSRDVPETRAIISGLGISRIGRRLGVLPSELTNEAARQAVADAGLTVDDIDGITTMGDTPISDTVCRARSMLMSAIATVAPSRI